MPLVATGSRDHKRPVPRLWRVFLFLSIFLSILGSAHYYVWARLIRDPALPGAWYPLLTAAFVVLFVSLPLGMILGRRAPLWARRFLLQPAFVWLGAMFLLFVSVSATDLVQVLLSRLVFSGAGSEDPIHMSRLYGLAAALLGAGSTGLALLEGYRFRVRRVEVPLERLPESMSGFRIVQLSDVHIGPSLGAEFARRVVETCNALTPDLVVITGDLVDAPVSAIGADVAEFGKLESKHGTHFVTGNHEYYAGGEAWCSALRAIGVRVLRNERVAIGENGVSFDLAGIDDFHAFGEGHGADLGKALAGRDPNRELVLLAHQPRAAFEAARHGVGLQLSGHTHGGQIWPFSWLVKLQQPIVAGLARIQGTWVYVSRGTGYWGPPMRLGAPAEVTEITLRRAATARA